MRLYKLFLVILLVFLFIFHIFCSNIFAVPPASPMDLSLLVKEFSEDKMSDIIVKIKKREGYPREWVNWPNTQAEINLPEGLKLISGNLKWQGDIIGDGVATFGIRVKAIKNGEWVVEAKAKYVYENGDSCGDIERVYILVNNDDKVLISETSFTPINPQTGVKELK